jgi:iron(III) transport system substrate-binding protein
MIRRRVARLLTVVALLAPSAPSAASPRPLATAAKVLSAANREGKVVLYSVTDQAVAAPLIADFCELFPRIQVEFREFRTAELQERILREVGEGRVEADLLWSPAMDLQMKLANDGLAMFYESPEAAQLPSWAVWRNEAFGTTLEPHVFVHDPGRLPTPPRSHTELVRSLERGPLGGPGKVATYDPERSGIGYLLLTQDSRIDPGFSDAVRAYGMAGAELHATTGDMLDRVLAGDILLAFNVNGSYALQAKRGHPRLAVVYPEDYVIATSRIALIPKRAPHPNAAKVFLDYLLSNRGQDVLARRCSLFSIRRDVEGELTAAALSRDLGARLKPVHLGPSLLVYLDAGKQADFLKRWKSAFGR